MRRSIAPAGGAACPSGLPAIGELPWGTHAAQFYRDRSELVETLVPYFQAGLEAHQRCLWIAAEPLSASDARAALEDVVPDLDARARDGQIEIVSGAGWSDADAVRAMLAGAEQGALARGFDGLRVATNALPVEHAAKAHDALHGRRAVALSCYALDLCDADAMIAVLNSHTFALVSRDGAWEATDSATMMLALGKPPSGTDLPRSADGQEISEALAQAHRALKNEKTLREEIERERDHLLDRERAARTRAQSATDHVVRLGELSASLFDAPTAADVAQIAVEDLVRTFGAAAAELWVVNENGALALASRAGSASFDAGGLYEEMSHLATPLWLSTRAQISVRAPALAASASTVAFAAVALVGRRLGVIGLFYPETHAQPAFERALLSDYARQVASALDRARSTDELRFARNRLQVLYDTARRERQRAERERQRAEHERRRAEDASRAKDEFLAMLGHELRNPLSPILTAVELMRLRGGDALEKERTIIERQVSRMVRLVDDLLDVSRITRGKVQLARERLEISRVVTDAIEIASPALEERAHRLTTEVPPSGLAVHGDADRLVQVVVNLLTNAAKYTPRGGRIDLVARAEAGRVTLAVSDDGLGIEPELLPKVFDIFVQGKRSSDRGEGGLGLGLAIARNITELHGGTLRAASEGRGRGSTFVLELPRADHARQTPAAPFRAIAPTQPRRVLIVDDNVDAARMLGDILEARGHTVQVSHDGPSALEIAPVFLPELALLDIGLPVMDGYELAERLRAALPDRPPRLVAVTGYGQDTDRERSSASGFAEHLVKPIDLRKLEIVIGS